MLLVEFLGVVDIYLMVAWCLGVDENVRFLLFLRKPPTTISKTMPGITVEETLVRTNQPNHQPSPLGQSFSRRCCERRVGQNHLPRKTYRNFNNHASNLAPHRQALRILAPWGSLGMPRMSSPRRYPRQRRDARQQQRPQQAAPGTAPASASVTGVGFVLAWALPPSGTDS